jgi:hypothetical protein
MVTHITTISEESVLAQEFIERLELLGHIFLWVDVIGAVHLRPKGWEATPEEEAFIEEHGDAIEAFVLFERQVQI